MTNEERYSRELGKICMWVEEFAKDDNDSTYLCFLRLLADYRGLQSQRMDLAVEQEEERQQSTNK
jgi:hypothetical protein